MKNKIIVSYSFLGLVIFILLFLIGYLLKEMYDISYSDITIILIFLLTLSVLLSLIILLSTKLYRIKTHNNIGNLKKKFIIENKGV